MARNDKISIVCQNRKASHEFEIIETLECGIELCGTEVKSLREKNASLNEAYARIDSNELWLIGFHISSYIHGPTTAHETTRRRKLLAHARQIRKLQQSISLKGYTLVPTRVYFNARGIAKVEIAVARGKAKSDKRESLKKREARRDIDRALHRRR